MLNLVDRCVSWYTPQAFLGQLLDFMVTLAERLVFSARLSIAVSSNPLIAFRVVGARVGQRLRVVWKDTRGDSRSSESIVIT